MGQETGAIALPRMTTVKDEKDDKSSLKKYIDEAKCYFLKILCKKYEVNDMNTSRRI